MGVIAVLVRPLQEQVAADDFGVAQDIDRHFGDRVGGRGKDLAGRNMRNPPGDVRLGRIIGLISDHDRFAVIERNAVGGLQIGIDDLGERRWRADARYWDRRLRYWPNGCRCSYSTTGR